MLRFFFLFLFLAWSTNPRGNQVTIAVEKAVMQKCKHAYSNYDAFKRAIPTCAPEVKVEDKVFKYHRTALSVYEGPASLKCITHEYKHAGQIVQVTCCFDLKGKNVISSTY